MNLYLHEEQSADNAEPASGRSGS